MGAREFLVAYNINLNTTSTRRANAIAFDVREKGRVKRRGHPLTGEGVRGDDGTPVYVPGSLQAVKPAIYSLYLMVVLFYSAVIGYHSCFNC